MEIPSHVLKRPLKFGDPEQIIALKQWRQHLEDTGETALPVKWLVTYTVEKTCIVWASSREDAELMASDEEGDFIDDIVSVECLDPTEETDGLAL